MRELILFLAEAIGVYFLVVTGVYALLLALSWVKMMRWRRTEEADLPGVSFLIPAYNEESLIVETIQTYLSLSHAKKEIIVINDGSSDQTMRLLSTMYLLRKTAQHVHQSISHPELRIINVPHMGKAQALNHGLHHSGYDLICTMDADTIPAKEGVEACLAAFARDKRLIGAGGVIQVMNSSHLKNNVPVEHPKSSWLITFQRIEYLRTFICERLGWSLLDSTLLISGAFCMVKKRALLKVGGFNHRSITEDLDLIVRVRKEHAGDGHRVKILPVTTCYTQAPGSLKHLMRQRVRWQLGLMQTLISERSLFLNPKYGITGIVAIPYLWLVELLSPVFELAAYVVVPAAWMMDFVSTEALFIWPVVGVLYNFFLSFAGMILDRTYVSGKKNSSWTKLALGSLFIHFGYKQLTMWWRLRALVKGFQTTQSWGEKPREEIFLQNF